MHSPSRSPPDLTRTRPTSSIFFFFRTKQSGKRWRTRRRLIGSTASFKKSSKRLRFSSCLYIHEFLALFAPFLCPRSIDHYRQYLVFLCMYLIYRFSVSRQHNRFVLFTRLRHVLSSPETGNMRQGLIYNFQLPWR